MEIKPKKYHRKSMRLQGYDYTFPGAYFVTMVTQLRECLFGKVVDSEMQVNQFGLIVEHAWMDLPSHYPQVTLEAFVVMPNHVHGIVVINECRGGSQTRPYRMIQHGLPEIVRAFKSFSAMRINQLQKRDRVAVWQRSFYDHIIRNEQDFRNIWEYIHNNPQKWQDDEFH